MLFDMVNLLQPNAVPQGILAKSKVTRTRLQVQPVNSALATRFKYLFVLLNVLYFSCLLAQASFWTFYLPNFLKRSGYNELSNMIKNLETEIFSTKDNFADIQYLWGQLQAADDMDPSLMYPEESACSELFPMFRDKAIEYTYIDYEHFMKPQELYLQHLIDFRQQWFPDGKKSKAVLPRVWEQNLYEKELEFKIEWHSKLTENPDFKSKRKILVETWKSVKRSLDTSLPCVYLRYAYRQMAEDINQLALDMNLVGMQRALEMVRSAYKRIEAIGGSSDIAAQQKIADDLERKSRLEIKT